jgi:hypothetical protein
VQGLVAGPLLAHPCLVAALYPAVWGAIQTVGGHNVEGGVLF